MTSNNIFSEQKFVSDFLSSGNSKGAFFADESEVFEQVETPVGIPDVLFVPQEDLLHIHQFQLKYPGLNLTNGHSRLISHISNSAYHTAKYLMRKANLSELHFNKVIKEFDGLGIIEYNQHNSIKLINDFSIPQVMIWSLEFKLKDWKAGLFQSLRYRSFSNESTVIMPMKMKDKLYEMRNTFYKYKVSSAVISEDGSVDFVVKPRNVGAISSSLYSNVLGRVMNLMVK